MCELHASTSRAALGQGEFLVEGRGRHDDLGRVARRRRQLIAAAGKPNERRGVVIQPAGRTWFRRAPELGASRDATSRITRSYPLERQFLSAHSPPLYGSCIAELRKNVSTEQHRKAGEKESLFVFLLLLLLRILMSAIGAGWLCPQFWGSIRVSLPVFAGHHQAEDRPAPHGGHGVSRPVG